MGMAASQVRLLTLQNRKSTIGLRLGTLAQREISLANSLDAVATEYTQALDQKTIKWAASTTNYMDITYDRLMSPIRSVNQYNPFILSNREGKVVLDTKYNDFISKSEYDYIFRNPNGEINSVKPAVDDYITSLGATRKMTGSALVYNLQTSKTYKNATIDELFDVLKNKLKNMDSTNGNYDDLKTVINNYEKNLKFYDSTTDSDPDYSVEDNRKELFAGSTGITALSVLKDVLTNSSTNQSINSDLDTAIESAKNYFCDNTRQLIKYSYGDQALENAVNGHMGTATSSYMPPKNNTGNDEEDQPVRIYNMAFSYKAAYQYILAELGGSSNPQLGIGSTETGYDKLVIEDPGTVTVPDIYDMALNISNTLEEYDIRSNENSSPEETKISYSQALKWLQSNYYYQNAENTAGINYWLEQYLTNANNEDAFNFITELKNSIKNDTDTLPNDLLRNRYPNANAFTRATTSRAEEYWTGIDQSEIDFYTEMFESIRDNGYEYQQNVTDKEYLKLMLENNMYLINDLYANSCPKVVAVCADEDEQAHALSKYKAQMALINEKEEDVALEMESLNTEYTAIKSEIGSIKQIIKDNIESTFNTNG